MRQAVSECRVKGSILREEGRVEAIFSFPKTFVGFSGHFPDNPILPGVVLILAAQSTIDLIRETPARLKKLTFAKFINPVRPDESIRVMVAVKSPELYTVSIMRPDKTPISTFSLTCG